jgi:DNA ligase-1
MPALQLFASMLSALESESGRNSKICILKAYLNGASGESAGARSLAKWALDPFRTFGVATFDVPDGPPKGDGKLHLADIEGNLLQPLSARRLTGNNALSGIATALRLLTGEPAPGETVSPRAALARILRKDLRCGVQASLINAACGDLVPVFGCQLAASEMPSPDELSYPVAVEPKYDGCRCLAVISGGKVTLLSRNGIAFLNFAEIEAELQVKLAPATESDVGLVLDGEVLGLVDDPREQYKAVMKRARGLPGTNTGIKVVYSVFDVLPLQAFQKNAGWAPWRHRRAVLERLATRGNFAAEDSVLRITPATLVASVHELQALYQNLVADGWEGVIVKDPGADYRCKRSRAWQKLKPMATADLTIVGAFEGSGKLGGMLGGLTLKGEHDGRLIESECGSGFDDATRRALWLERDALPGRIAEVKYQDITETNGRCSLRFPVFQRLRVTDSLGLKD